MLEKILIVGLLTIIAGLGMILSLRERKRECINKDVIFGYKNGVPAMLPRKKV